MLVSHPRFFCHTFGVGIRWLAFGAALANVALSRRRNSLTNEAPRATHCPLCFEPLEVREVGPCMACGSHPREIDEARAGKHTYAEWCIFGELRLVLCNFCSSDFSSYDPTFFGLPRRTDIGMNTWQFVRDVQPMIVKDKCCPACGHRLPFLEFVARARELHSRHED
jgi:hypothetical protein